MKFTLLWVISCTLVFASPTPALGVKELCYHKNPCTGCGKESVCHLDAAEAHAHPAWKCSNCIRRDRIRTEIGGKRRALQDLQKRLTALTADAGNSRVLQSDLREARSKLAEAQSLLTEIANSNDTSLLSEAERKVAKWDAKLSEISAKLQEIEEKNARIETVKANVESLENEIENLEAQLK